MKKDIHRGGRPAIQRGDTFYMTLLDRYQTHSTRQLAEVYGVSAATICNWLKKARERFDYATKETI